MSDSALAARTASQTWTLIIRPRRPWLDLRLGELWQARDLILLFVRRDFVAVYTQTVLGPLWFLLQPLLTTLVFTVVFGRVTQLSSDGLPPFLFYLAGTVLWSYFASCFSKTAATFTGNAGLFSKVYFPRLATPISIVISNLMTFAIQFCVFVIAVLWFWSRGAVVRPGASMLLLPVCLLLMAGLGLGFGIIVAALTTRYRDFQHLVTFGVQLLMFATPVIYPLSAVPRAYRPWLAANPLTEVVEAFRYGFLGAGTVTVGGLAYSAAFTLATLLLGLLLFNRIEQNFVDTV